MTRVLIVDDHAVVRSGLRLVLEADEAIEPVGEAGSARDAIFEARALKPDVILLDVVMPDQSGLDIIPTLLHENPDTKICHLDMKPASGGSPPRPSTARLSASAASGKR